MLTLCAPYIPHVATRPFQAPSRYLVLSGLSLAPERILAQFSPVKKTSLFSCGSSPTCQFPLVSHVAGTNSIHKTPMKTQVQMFYEASRHVANELLTKQLAQLQLKRSQAVSAWRENGKTDTLWEAVETIDRQMEPIEQTLLARA